VLNERHWKRLLQKESVDAMLAEHVWEHLSEEEGLAGARRCYEYLKPGGYLRVAVPDGYHPDADYIEHVKIGGTGVGAKGHRVLYNHESLTRVFEEAGFTVRLLEYFDAAGFFQEAQWDANDGNIHRSKRLDERNACGALAYTSIILDAFKDG
jgi:predicted SAM-dependent methyltransferase